jgi:serine phosphatase RsbU (regulator of sigma subunit)
MLQLAARALDSTSPGEVLAQVNETLFARIPSNMFVTCFYAILDPNSGRFTYANAGHDLPYLWHGGEAEELRARGMPLGLMPGMSYEEKERVLEPRACYELGRKSHRNADSTVGLVPSRSLFPAFLSCF